MTDSERLTFRCNPNVPLTPYDGRVGAIIGEFVYTTPNENFIPLPISGDRKVQVRRDYRYRPDDHTLWPQPYSSLAPHLAVIPRKPSDPNDTLAPLWHDPQESHFIDVARGSVASGIGKLDSGFLSAIRPIAENLRGRFFKYAKALPAGKEPNHVAASLERISGFALHRLTSLATTWPQIQFTVTELQRLLLELHGCLDYLEIYKPNIDFSLSGPANPATARTIGTFTSNPRVVEEFSAVGVPVWFIRKRNPVGFGSNVLAEVRPRDYRELLVMDVHPDFPVVFKGNCDADSFTVVTHVLQFSRHWLRSPDPFSSLPSPSPSSSSSPLTPPSSSMPLQGTLSRGPGGKPPAKKFKPTTASSAAGRDKFQPLDSPLAPFSISTWAEQLQNVDRTQPPAINQPPRGGFYAFPDPGLFISVQNNVKRQFMIEQFCRIADIWLCRISQSSGTALSNDQWRNLLSIDFSKPHWQWATGNTKTAARQRAALNELMPRGCNPRSIASNEPYLLMGPEESFASGVLPPDQSLRKFNFILYWLNFRVELLALDRVANENLAGKSEQDLLLRENQIIMELFPAATFQLPLFDPPNIGLAADTLRKRLPFLRGFARIMTSWKDEKPHIFRLGKHQSGADKDISLSQAEELEREIAWFYCQKFFVYFRRAAQIPHRLYPPSVQT